MEKLYDRQAEEKKMFGELQLLLKEENLSDAQKKRIIELEVCFGELGIRDIVRVARGSKKDYTYLVDKK